MAEFPATTAVSGKLSAADKQKLVDLAASGAVLSIVWFHLLPQPASNGTPANTTESGVSYVTKARFIFNFDRLNISNTTLSGKMYARGLVGSGNGDIRLFNVTDSVELGVINFTETIATTKSIDLTGLPTTGTKVLECQLRKPAGSGAVTIESASCDFLLSS